MYHFSQNKSVVKLNFLFISSKDFFRKLLMYFLMKAYTIVTMIKKMENWSRIVCIILNNVTYYVKSNVRSWKYDKPWGEYPSLLSTFSQVRHAAVRLLLLTVSMLKCHLSSTKNAHLLVLRKGTLEYTLEWL